MGRKGKYVGVNTNKNKEKQNIIAAALIIISLFTYLYVIRNIMTKMQWNLFCNSNTLLLIPSSFWGLLIEMFSGTVFVISISLCLYYRFKQSKVLENYGKLLPKYGKLIRSSLLVSIISFVLLSFSFFSYCRADIDGLYIRDIRTIFAEKKYSWKELKSVDINYYKNSKGAGYNLQYLLNFDGFNVNIQDAGLTNGKDLIDNGKKEIHRIIKENNIPISKNIREYNNEIKEFLKLIEEDES